MTLSPASDDAKLPQGPGKLILRAEEAAAWRDGFKFLEAAQKQAAEMIDAAQESIKKKNKQGYVDGRAQGAAEASQLLLKTSRQVNAYISSSEKQIAKLAMTIVRNILGEIGEAKLMGAVAAQAISAFRNETAVTVTVHPSQEKNVYAFLEKFTEKNTSFPSITLQVDKSLAPTGCILATNIAHINASIDVQLAAITNSFEDNAFTSGAA